MPEGPTPDRRWVQLTIVCLLVLGGSAGTALADHTARETQDIWHVSHSVDATVVDNYATVRVGIEIVNEGPDPEFPFRVEIPEEAYVTGLTITRDGETYEAQVKPSQEAREQYEEAKNEQRSAGLVEQQRSDDVYAYNINVEGRETVEAELTYETYLTAEAGVYTLPLMAPATQRGVDEGATFDVTIEHAAGLDDVRAPHGADVEWRAESVRVTHDVGPRGQHQATDFPVRYEVPDTDAGGRLTTTVEDGTGYFAHRFRASDAQDRVPLDISLVLDTSGSMDGDKIEQVRQATTRLVDVLDERDRLHVTLFSGDTESPWEGFEPVEPDVADRAVQALEHARATGSTNIAEALRDGLGPFEDADSRPDRLPVLVFLTDGQPTRGIEDPDELRRLALESNEAGAHVFSLAFGANADFELVHGLAEDGDGLAQRVEADHGAEVDLSSFLTALTSPVLTDVSVDYTSEDVEAHRLGAPVLFAGSELVYVGTVDPEASQLEARVEARSVNGTQAWNVTEPVETGGPAYLDDLVAYQRIRALEDRIDAYGPNQTLVDRVTELALEHDFVTDHTSLVVDLPEDHDPVPASPEATDDRAVSGTADPVDRDGAPAESGDTTWTDGDQQTETPGPGLVAGLAVLAGAALLLRRTSR